MNYRITLKEHLDRDIDGDISNVSILELFVEIDGQIYRSTRAYLDKDKKKLIGEMFIEIGRRFN